MIRTTATSVTTRPCRSGATRPRRDGFTLVELMVVIIIIGILAALLIPAINRTRIATREAQVVAEIKALDAAIADFQSRYGVVPPSFIVLYEAGDTGSGTDPSWETDTSSNLPGTQDVYRRASRAAIRRIWPDFNFAGSVDLNQDGDTTDVHILNGGECLAFFLGGIPEQVDTDGDGTNDSWSATGFAENPLAPFAPRSIAPSRVGPFHEQFNPARMTDIDGDLMPEFVDTIPNQLVPYQYFSSYDGRGYQPLGLDLGDPRDDERLPVGLIAHYVEESPPTPAFTARPIEPNSYQIISPGYDQEFGIGGFYNSENVPLSEDVNRNMALDPGEDTNGNGTIDDRRPERDNITNFKGGRLN